MSKFKCPKCGEIFSKQPHYCPECGEEVSVPEEKDKIQDFIHKLDSIEAKLSNLHTLKVWNHL